MVWVMLGIAGSVLFAVDRYNHWKISNRNHIIVVLKSVGAGLGLLCVLALIILIASI